MMRSALIVADRHRRQCPARSLFLHPTFLPFRHWRTRSDEVQILRYGLRLLLDDSWQWNGSGHCMGLRGEVFDWLARRILATCSCERGCITLLGIVLLPTYVPSETQTGRGFGDALGEELRLCRHILVRRRICGLPARTVLGRISIPVRLAPTNPLDKPLTRSTAGRVRPLLRQ